MLAKLASLKEPLKEGLQGLDLLTLEIVLEPLKIAKTFFLAKRDQARALTGDLSEAQGPLLTRAIEGFGYLADFV